MNQISKTNNTSPTVHLHTYDLPFDITHDARKYGVAYDTEAMGLKYHRDRLCTVQLSLGDNVAHVVHFPEPIFDQSPNLCKMLADPTILKIAHYARFDVGIVAYTWGIRIDSVYCTKIASRLCRTYTDKHGLKDLCKDLLGVELTKETRASDWGAPKLTAEQLRYASHDVLYLHRLKAILDNLIQREKRTDLLQAYNQFLPYRAELDILVGDHFEPINYHMHGG